MEEQVYHIPALLPQVLEALDIKPDGTYVDVTLGGGGHSRAIVEKLSADGHLYSMDQDRDAIDRAFSDQRFTVIHGNFKFLKNFMRYYHVDGVDGLLADLGVSFHHFDDPERGFSFRWEGRLDMRMNRNAALDAAKVLNDYSEQQLADMFYLFGELKNARRLASAIVKQRATEPIVTVEQLRRVITPFI
ncbi:MAG: 16S rRNA (cytosine(1402)-N(4))-methyltransferase RsmH, partial [Muribaculaceae bacterium]|nr:16S rRNA (cytosine(1402)-N(4))-methyltransferase RsmH [Muribaculaceae bacterium]